MSEPWPDTFGDVTGEYLALRREAALVGGRHRLLWVRGPDAVAFLDGLLSQDVGGMAVGAVARSFLLQPKGKLQALLWLLRGDDRVGLVGDVPAADATPSALERFRFRVDAALEDDERELLEVWGREAGTVLERAGLPAPQGWEADGETLVASAPLGDLPRYLVAGVPLPVLEDAGARPAGLLAATAVRVEAGEPVMGVDVDEATIPHETGLVPAAVSFAKGCYLGQELVARIESRGRVNRHLRGVVVTENVLPPAGAEVAAGDADVGLVTSLGESLALRAPVGLALLRREVADGDTVTVRWAGGAVPAVVRDLPLDDFADP